VKFLDQIPHAQVVAGYGSTDLQLLVLAHTAIAPGNLPGKFFEYLASGKPILGIGPVNGDAAEILNQTKAGVIVERTDTAGIKAALLSYYQNWKEGISSKSSGIEMYTREQLTKKLIGLLEDF
jgi:glycosyltransferase involved in cell wall biosynthesis